MSNPIGPVTQGGVYGRETPREQSKCPQRNNSFGHNRECACGWFRASQVTPYMDEVPDGEL